MIRAKKKDITAFLIVALVSVLSLLFVLQAFCSRQPDIEPAVYLTPSISETSMPMTCVTMAPEPQYMFSNDEIYLMAQLLCGDKNTDGDGEYDVDFQQTNELNYYEVGKVFCVVMNRVQDDRFPNTVTDVILAKNQFVVMPKNQATEPSEKALEITKAWCEAYKQYDIGVQCMPEDHIYFTGNGLINETRS